MSTKIEWAVNPDGSQGKTWNPVDDVPDSYIDQVFAVMALCPQHTFQVLTKRPERMHKYLSNSECREHICEAIAFNALKWDAGTAAEKLGGKWESPQIDEYGRVELAGYFDGVAISWPLPNVWVGVTAENQEQADKRIPLLLQTPAALRFVSVEPMLGPVELLSNDYLGGCINCESYIDCPEKCTDCNPNPRVDWVVCGGETGPGARPMHPDWVRSLRDQCQDAGVPFFFKSWGEHCYPEQMSRFGKKAADAMLDGREWREMPNRRAEHE